MKAPTGHYRKLISNPYIRIAFTHTPIYGCIVVDSTKVIEELRQSNDEYAQYYIDGLTSGSTVTIIERTDQERYFSPGELYFTS
jgi:predicted transcriptional regulator